MTLPTMPQERITRGEIEQYKQQILSASVLVTPRDAATILSCSPRKVYDLVQGGHLQAHGSSHRSKGLRILAESLKDYVRSIKIDVDAWRE